MCSFLLPKHVLLFNIAFVNNGSIMLLVNGTDCVCLPHPSEAQKKRSSSLAVFFHLWMTCILSPILNILEVIRGNTDWLDDGQNT